MNISANTAAAVADEAAIAVSGWNWLLSKPLKITLPLLGVMTMAYTLQAIITSRDIVATALPEAISFAELPQGMVLIPFSEHFCEAAKIALVPLIADETRELPAPIETMCRTLSLGRKLVYVEAEFFGGVGTQAAALFDDGELLAEVLLAPDAINRALEFMGVEARGATDAFEALELHRHRDTELWFDEARGLAQR